MRLDGRRENVEQRPRRGRVSLIAKHPRPQSERPEPGSIIDHRQIMACALSR